jgi:hypothetical protein
VSDKDPQPIACSLGAEALGERLATMEALGREGLVDSERDGSTIRLRFKDEDGFRDRLGEVIDAERRCCPFLDLGLSEAGGGELTLTISAPEEGQPAADEIAAAFAGERAART